MDTYREICLSRSSHLRVDDATSRLPGSGFGGSLARESEKISIASNYHYFPHYGRPAKELDKGTQLVLDLGRRMHSLALY